MSCRGSIGITGEEVNMKKRNSTSKRAEDQLRQTTLWEFMDGEGSRNNSNRDDLDNGVVPTTRTKLEGEGGPS